MRRLLGVLLIALIPCLAPAAEEAKPNTLTPQEIGDGWLLLFDGDTTFGWNLSGSVQVAKGALILGGSVPTTAELTTYFGKSNLNFEYQGRGAAATLHVDGSAKQKSRSSVSLQPAPDWQAKAVVGTVGYPITLRFEVPAHASLHLRNLKVKPAGLQSIFNGKDLSGWKEIQDGRTKMKSKFTVAADGTLNIKDGPGDLQSEQQWADFVLQIDCISHGDHLNSGVFFRCIPNAYRQGYEAQIRNEFHDKPDQPYTLETYDPETHKPLKKEKALYAAVDYGTGAIYRRQPARKKMANDREWFTMTIVAEGRHLATWVNGIQVTDWIDNRPLNNNARNGCRLEKGRLSLQGHDPTTNLSFRNIRIGALPSATPKN